MTTTADTREVLLASLRADLLNEFDLLNESDPGMIPLDELLAASADDLGGDVLAARIASRMNLYADHAVDAALASGATLPDVLSAVIAEVEARGKGPLDTEGADYRNEATRGLVTLAALLHAEVFATAASRTV
jgi:hypothetical protein